MRPLLFVSALSLSLSLYSPLGLADKDKGKGKQDWQPSSESSQSGVLKDILTETERQLVWRILYGKEAPKGSEQQNLSQHKNKGLPPGIAKNLARGKPLPPGIAKRYDQNTLAKLPQKPGYEWRELDGRAILVETASQVIVEVISRNLGF
ncbi:anti-virulence regulator CigR family protein [Balneatrix alpica]|uniref:anti-virulence regulator CigR family protein n=1 Tax=Balneatrix alpica TaxID=75684 RepID=UPI00273A1EAF|nr:anti-virulence regulator CigR family protein [Balneatrix alpica]